MATLRPLKEGKLSFFLKIMAGASWLASGGKEDTTRLPVETLWVNLEEDSVRNQRPEAWRKAGWEVYLLRTSLL